MKFVMFVEGQTEKNSIGDFIKRWLDPRLARPVGISVVRFRGFGEYLTEIKDRVDLHLTGKNKDEIIGAIGLIDLYGPEFFPAGLSSPQKAAWGKKELEKRVGNPKFRQYFAVHETEAWLLAHPEILPLSVRESLPARCAQPESVNTNEPPSKLLARLYRDRLNRDYRKVVDGRNLFLRCSPDMAAAKCAHFSQLLLDLEQLSQ